MPEPTPPPPAFLSKEWLKGFARANAAQLILWLAGWAIYYVLTWAGANPPKPPPPDIIWHPPDDPGWRPPTDDERESTFTALKVPRFRNTEAGRAVQGDGDAPVWRLAFKGRARPIPTRDQGSVGSCVSFGFSSAVEYTMAAQVALSKQRQDLPDSCQEALYAGSRVEANGGRVPFSGDGSTGAWAAKWLESIGGVLPRGVYGSHDLTAYDVNRCRQWGSRGVPDELEAECRKHKTDCALVASLTELDSALAQGYAVAICSNVGFQSNAGADGRPTRDADGFLRAQGSWSHCMVIIGRRTDKPGYLILNSWGSNWVTGPKGQFEDIPDGSFWARPADVTRILSQQDSWAVANSEGFRKRQINPVDWLIRNNRNAPLFGGWANVFALAP